jgi:CRP-like cAMP-binding protein
MIESIPPDVAGRVLAMTRIAPFQILPPAELSRLALAGREEVVVRRRVLVKAGERPDALYLPLRGDLSMAGGEKNPDWNPARLAGLALLGEGCVRADLVAPSGTVLLVLERDTALAVLEENGQLCRQLLRALACQLRTVRQASGPAFRVSGHPTPDGTDLVSRMLVLRKLLGPGGGGIAVVTRLARVARELRLASGTAVAPAPRGTDVLIITHGSLRLLPNQGTARLARAGEVVGLAEAVAGVPLPVQAVATVPTAALVISQSELAQAIEDDDSLCLELIRGFAAELLIDEIGRDALNPHHERTNPC